jgi:methyl acetate hydrolase
MLFTRRKFGVALAALGAGRVRGSDEATINATLRTGIAQRKIPAAVAMVASDNNVTYSGAFGTRDSSGAHVSVNSIFSIASMTKAITTVAALQLVEMGKVKLDEPVSRVLPQLAKLEVLDGFDKNGEPKMRSATTPLTLRHLLTHTSGICYNIWDADMFKYQSKKKVGPVPPLMFEPGTRWQYGMGIDWAGKMVEAISGMNLEDYFQMRILKPLEMNDTSFLVPPDKFDRVVSNYSKQKDGSLKQDPREAPKAPKEYNGGGGLYSNCPDYVKFMQMILQKGGKQKILSPATVESMEVNQIGSATAGKMKSYNPSLSSDVDIQPGAAEKWGLGFLINTTAYEGGRSAGSLAWAGIFNTFYWIDPKQSLCAVLMMQFLPFVDKEAVGMLGDFEKSVYAERKG